MAGSIKTRRIQACMAQYNAIIREVLLKAHKRMDLVFVSQGRNSIRCMEELGRDLTIKSAKEPSY
jgi:hypothetical protein